MTESDVIVCVLLSLDCPIELTVGFSVIKIFKQIFKMCSPVVLNEERSDEGECSAYCRADTVVFALCTVVCEGHTAYILVSCNVS